VSDAPAAVGALPANHALLLYATAEDFATTLVPFVQAGIEADEGIVAVALPSNLGALQESLGPTPSSVRFVPAGDWYARPPDTLGRWVSFALDQLAVGRPRVRIIGEVVWPEDPALQWEMRRFESAATVAFDALDSLVVCPYATNRYPDAVIDAARSTHPVVIERGVASVSSARLVEQSWPTLLVPGQAESRSFQPFDVLAAAAFVEGQARLARVAERPVQALVAATSEVVANAYTHAGSPVEVSAWAEDYSFVCQIEDEGAGIDDPTIGYHPPYRGDERWGLWLARRLSDMIEVGRGERGTAIRLRASRQLTPFGRKV